MVVKTTRPVTSTYRKLVTRFPLRAIHDDAEHAAALAVAKSLMETDDLDEGGAEYLDVLASLIEEYELKICPVPVATEADVLRFFMADRNMSQNALAKKTGISQSAISAALNGTRGLTKEHVITLAEFFHTSPVVFLPRSAKSSPRVKGNGKQ